MLPDPRVDPVSHLLPAVVEHHVVSHPRNDLRSRVIGPLRAVYLTDGQDPIPLAAEDEYRGGDATRPGSDEQHVEEGQVGLIPYAGVAVVDDLLAVSGVNATSRTIAVVPNSGRRRSVALILSSTNG